MAEEWKRARFGAVIEPVSTVIDLLQVPSGFTWHVNRGYYKRTSGPTGTILFIRTDSANTETERYLNEVVGAGSELGNMVELTNLRGAVLTDQDKIRGSDSSATASQVVLVLFVLERPT